MLCETGEKVTSIGSQPQSEHGDPSTSSTCWSHELTFGAGLRLLTQYDHFVQKSQVAEPPGIYHLFSWARSPFSCRVAALKSELTMRVHTQCQRLVTSGTPRAAVSKGKKLLRTHWLKARSRKYGSQIYTSKSPGT